MQLATASYVCPSMSMQDMAQSKMENCDGMDKTQSTLCHLSLKNPYKKQTLDKPLTPDISEFMIVGLVLSVYLNEVDFISNLSITEFKLTRTTSPPLSIQHCCYRI